MPPGHAATSDRPRLSGIAANAARSLLDDNS